MDYNNTATSVDTATNVDTCADTFTNHDTTVDTATLVTALVILRQSWCCSKDQQQQQQPWALQLMRMVLDLLEFRVLPDIYLHRKECIAILQLLQRWCLDPNGVALLRTQFGLPNQQQQWSCTGISVVVRIWNKVLVQRTSSGDSNNDNNTIMSIAANCVRLLHLVLWHVRRDRERCEQSNNNDKNNTTYCSFRSVLVEHAELHRAACNTMLILEDTPQEIKQLVAMQLQEILEDEEELQDILRQMAASKK